MLSEREDAGKFALIVTFHAHQSIEKYPKALLVAKGETPPRIHALPGLFQRAITHISDLDTRELRDTINNLNAYYIPSRYPAEVDGQTGPITVEEATEALAWAADIVSAVRVHLTASED